jgi:hypothetical protein
MSFFLLVFIELPAIFFFFWKKKRASKYLGSKLRSECFNLHFWVPVVSHGPTACELKKSLQFGDSWYSIEKQLSNVLNGGIWD